MVPTPLRLPWLLPLVVLVQPLPTPWLPTWHLLSPWLQVVLGYEVADTIKVADDLGVTVSVSTIS